MKPNLIVFHQSDAASESAVETLCENFCDSHYVYLIRPGSEFRDDSPAGVRYLNHTLDRLPGFADVALTIAVGEPELEDALRSAYPESASTGWDPSYGQNFCDSIGWDIPGPVSSTAISARRIVKNSRGLCKNCG